MEEEESIDFGDLSHDENFKRRITSFRKDVTVASKMIDDFLTRFNYDELSLEDKVRYDLFLAFAINSYFWMYLRLRGVDPNEHEIKGQINRVREYMNRSKKIYEKNTLMPRIDQGAAKRFIRSGLWMPQKSKAPESSSSNSESEVPAKRQKKRFDSPTEEGFGNYTIILSKLEEIEESIRLMLNNS